ncbi:MAG: hypothetical protein ACJ71U_02795 [Terriglobales bacterium]
MITIDPEVTAMGEISRAFDKVPEDARARVLNWILQKYGNKQDVSLNAVSTASNASSSEFSDFASLFHAADPRGQTEAALVSGYWLQVCNNQNEWESLSANSELKNLGQPMANITETLTRLIKSNPRLVMQTSKSGSAKQARKKYKLTLQGIKKVQAMLTASAQASS